MNKICQRIITTGVVIIAIFSVLSYSEIKDLRKSTDYMADYKLKYIEERLQSTNNMVHNIWNDTTAISQESYYLADIFNTIKN